ncbi:MAG: hypothetical protein IPH59_01580 [bacterium]|nr:hypothetical protein [bacterium]
MQIYPNSLAKTVESVEEAFFFGEKSPQTTRDQVARWIATRQGLDGSYADMFAPTPFDMKNGIRLFTGERVQPSASLRHVSGEEACRAMVHLNSKSKEAKAALARATAGMTARLNDVESNKHGMFCCGTCDPALWRNITSGGLHKSDRWLSSGMKALKAHRDDQGRWRRFPFFFTLLALVEIDLKAARDEMKYAAPKCESYIARNKGTRPIIKRRLAVAERVLEIAAV